MGELSECACQQDATPMRRCSAAERLHPQLSQVGVVTHLLAHDGIQLGGDGLCGDLLLVQARTEHLCRTAGGVVAGGLNRSQG